MARLSWTVTVVWLGLLIGALPACRKTSIDEGEVVTVEVAASSEKLTQEQDELTRKQEALATEQADLERQRRALQQTMSGEALAAKEQELEAALDRLKGEQQKAGERLKSLDTERAKLAAQRQTVTRTLQTLDENNTMAQREGVVALREQGMAAKERELVAQDLKATEQLVLTQRQIEKAIDRARSLMKERGLTSEPVERPKKGRQRGK